MRPRASHFALVPSGFAHRTRFAIFMSTDFYCDSVLSGRVPVIVAAETARVLAFEHANRCR